uniref:Uncharacterized protein n=1 Tax=Caenorhabditis japonica TaxID=281687 RepID=A0A8R1IZE0_CAEJA
MFRSDFSKPHYKCMRNSMGDWSEFAKLYTGYTSSYCQVQNRSPTISSPSIGGTSRATTHRIHQQKTRY